MAVAGVASKEHKVQLEAEYDAGAAQGTAGGVAQCRAEDAATGAEYKVQLEAEVKARPARQSTRDGLSDFLFASACRSPRSCGLPQLTSPSPSMRTTGRGERAQAAVIAACL